MPTPSSILPFLASAEYPLDLAQTGSVLLTDGVFEGIPAPGSATSLRVWIDNMTATGDLDGDGDVDAATILLVDPGGSGTYRYLAGVLNESGRAQVVGTAFLGDRVDVEALTVHPGAIVVTILQREAGEPLTNPPTIPSEAVFALVDGQLVRQE